MKISDSKMYNAVESLLDKPADESVGLAVVTVHEIMDCMDGIAEKHSLQRSLRNDDYRGLIRQARQYLLENGWEKANVEGFGVCLTRVVY